MKTPTGEIDLRADISRDAEDSGLTGGLELYDEMGNFIDLPGETDRYPENRGLPGRETNPPDAGGGLWQSDDVISVPAWLSSYTRPAGATLSVCADCGSSSDGDELFCIRCDGPLEEQASVEPETVSAARRCADCSGIVEFDEIFCPSCGSVIPDA